jgi:hypothetical protein
VFSHVGGAPGNDVADRLARRGCAMQRNPWKQCAPVACVDSTRRILRARHDAVDRLDATMSFRKRHMPPHMTVAPDAPLEGSFSRRDEILLFRARLGLCVRAGGMLHGVASDCPVCDEVGALGRDGVTMEHLAECVPENVDPPGAAMDLGELWSKPASALVSLRMIDRVVKLSQHQPAAPGANARTWRRQQRQH